jgi:hypothetical protein
MDKFKLIPRWPAPHRPVRVLACGPFEFDVDGALRLAADGTKYRAERRWPRPEWVNPFLDAESEEADLSRPVLFASLITDGRPWQLLIDGNSRVRKALRRGVAVAAITLDLADTLRIVRGPPQALEEMRRDGAGLGLLR